MPGRHPTERIYSLRALLERSDTMTFGHLPVVLEHLYVKLEFDDRFERATNGEDARKFFRSLARAVSAAARLAKQHRAEVLEVQGSVLHIALEATTFESRLENVRAYAQALHRTLSQLFDRPQSRVVGWRMVADSGMTLVVMGRGIHHDESLVSIGSAANRPAVYLHSQLSLSSEDRRSLKRFDLAVPDAAQGEWLHERLGDERTLLSESEVEVAQTTRSEEPAVRFKNLRAPASDIFARQAAIGPPGDPNAPTEDQPTAYYGWIMRADIDGFSRLVHECGDDLEALRTVAEQFRRIMDSAAAFADIHRETLVQLPWAGDNFTAAVVFTDKSAYLAAVGRRLVEFSLDFEKEMSERSTAAHSVNWAHGVAGGEIVGNSAGNVYVAGLSVADRRFLVAAGDGVGRSTQAMIDVQPDSAELALFHVDVSRLDEAYRGAFGPATNRRGQTSSLFRVAQTGDLVSKRARLDARTAGTVVTVGPAEARTLLTRPFSP